MIIFKTGEARALYNLGNIYQSKGKHMGRLLCNRDPTEFPMEVKEVLMQAVNYYRYIFKFRQDLIAFNKVFLNIFFEGKHLN